MKKILSVSIFILLVVTSVFGQKYSPKRGQTVTKPISPSVGIPLDGRAQFPDTIHGFYRPFLSTAEALSTITPAYRQGQFTIQINRGGSLDGSFHIVGGVNEDWWFRDGIADSNLVKKNYYTAADSAKWNAGYNKIITSISYDSTTGVITFSMRDGTILKDTIKAAGLVVGENNYPQSISIDPTTRLITITRAGKTPISTFFPPFSTDSIKGYPIDTSFNRDGYVLTFDSVLHKFYLTPGGGGGGGGGTVVGLSKTDAYGILNTIANPTVNPNITSVLDSATVFQDIRATLTPAIALKLDASAVFTRTAKDSSENPATTRYTDKAIQAVKVDIIANDTFNLKVNPKWFKKLGRDTLDLNIDSLPHGTGSSGPIYWYGNTDTLKANKPADGSIGYTNEYKPGYGGHRMRYLYVAGSAATGNDMTILTPTAGGSGRWFIYPEDGRVYLRSLGIIPGTSNSAAINTAIGLVAGIYDLYVDRASDYKIDMTIPVVPKDYLHLYFEDSTARFSAKSYTNQPVGGGFMMKFRTGSSGTRADTLHGFIMDGFTLSGGMSFAGHVVTSAVIDTNQFLLEIYQGDSCQIRNGRFLNGGTAAATYFFSNSNFHFEDNYIDNIGSTVLDNSLDSVSHDVWILRNKFHRYGMLDKWDTELGLQFRSGAPWLLGGGYNFHVNYNEAWNDALTEWFQVEARHNGFAEYVGNIYHGMGINSGGFSLGGHIHYGQPARGLVVKNNVQFDIPFKSFTALHDSRRTEQNLWEMSLTQGLEISGNTFVNAIFSIGRQSADISIHDNIDSCPGMGPGLISGGAILFNWGVSNSSGRIDTIFRTNIYNNRFYADSAELVRFNAGGCKIDGFYFVNNPVVSIKNFTDIAQIYIPASTQYHNNIVFDKNTFAGHITDHAFFTDNIGSGAVISFAGNEVSKLDLDTASNFVTDFHVASKINKEGTVFSTGVYSEKYPDAFRISGSDLIIGKNGKDAQTITLPSTGGSDAAFYPAGTTNNTAVDNSSAINAAIVAANAAFSTTGTKQRVVLAAGTWLVRTSYRDTATVNKPSGIKLLPGVILQGAGTGATIIKASPPPTGATFAAGTFITNTKFRNIILADGADNASIQDLSIDGNISNQINYDINPYFTVQDGIAYDSCTDGIRVKNSSNFSIKNVKIDSITGYSIAIINSPNALIDNANVGWNINGGVYFTGYCKGGKLINSKVMHSSCDNVRLRSGDVTISNNEIGWTKFNPDIAGANFAGIYVENDYVGIASITGIKVYGNRIHDNSSYAIDMYNAVDTNYFTYPASSVMLDNNYIYKNANGGVQVQMPKVTVQGNHIELNGADSLGESDPVGYSPVGISSHGTHSNNLVVQNNAFLNNSNQAYAYGSNSSGPVPLLTFTGNTVLHGAAIMNTTAYPLSNNSIIHDNSFTDSVSNVTIADYKIDSIGVLHLAPSVQDLGATLSGTIYLHGTHDVQFYGLHEDDATRAFYIGNVPNGFGAMMGFKLNSYDAYQDPDIFHSGTALSRTLTFFDFQGGGNRGAVNSTGDFIWGSDFATSNFILDNTGKTRGITYRAGGGTNTDIRLSSQVLINNLGVLNVNTPGTNTSATLRIIPNGTGYSGSGGLMSNIGLFNNPYLTDPTNYEALGMSANGTDGYAIGPSQGGTGSLRDFKLQMNAVDKIVFKANGDLQILDGTVNQSVDTTTWKPLVTDSSGTTRKMYWPQGATTAYTDAAIAAAVAEGFYTPTVTGVTNTTSSTAYQLQYDRVLGKVTVSGHVLVTATTTANTEFRISLPIASTFSTVDLLGGAFSTGVNGGKIYSDVTNGEAYFKGNLTIGSNDMYFTFMYHVTPP